MIVLLGSTGYIGSVFAKELKRRKLEFTTLSHVAPKPWCFAFNDLVINCAAFITRPSVDLCEDHKGDCLRGNLLFPVMVANMCHRSMVPLMNISTGCLYNGDNGGAGWSETDAAQLTFDNGAGYYVGCKQLAEQKISEYPLAYNCRIRLPFDEQDDGRNYISKLIRFLKVFQAQNSLSHRGDFVNACLDLWQMRAPFGTYNMTNPGSIRTSEIVAVVKKHLLPKSEFRYWDETDFLTKVARTPKSNCVLSVDKLLSAGVKMRSTPEAVEDAIKRWVWNKDLCTETLPDVGPAAPLT